MYELDGQVYNLPISLVKSIRLPSFPQLPSAVSVMSLLLLCLKKSLKVLPSFILLRSPWYCRSRNALTIASPKDLSLKELWFTINFALKTLGLYFQRYFTLELVSALSTCIVDGLLLTRVSDSIALPAGTHRCKTN